jgi:flagellar hook-basal body complex protein FliE
MTTTSISSAINAYSALAKAAGTDDTADTASTDASATGGGDFSAMLKNAAQSAIGTLRTGESATAAGIAGKADIRDVVSAVTNAQLTLQTVVNVRDKILTAYNDIIKMAI